MKLIIILILALPLAACAAGALQGWLGSKVGKSRTPLAIISYFAIVLIALVLF